MLAALLKALPENFLNGSLFRHCVYESAPIERHACAMAKVMTMRRSYHLPHRSMTILLMI
jgi:hypothetical protein